MFFLRLKCENETIKALMFTSIKALMFIFCAGEPSESTHLLLSTDNAKFHAWARRIN